VCVCVCVWWNFQRNDSIGIRNLKAICLCRRALLFRCIFSRCMFCLRQMLLTTGQVLPTVSDTHTYTNTHTRTHAHTHTHKSGLVILKSEQRFDYWRHHLVRGEKKDHTHTHTHIHTHPRIKDTPLWLRSNFFARGKNECERVNKLIRIDWRVTWHLPKYWRVCETHLP